MERLLTVDQVADILGISVKTVHKLARDSKLGCVKVTAKDRRFTQKQVRDFIDSQSSPVIDKSSNSRISSPQEGGDKSIGVSGTDLRKEMRSW